MKGGVEPLRVTTTHKMYSASRKGFAPAGELKEGENLIDRNGPVQIASIEPYPSKYRVYNLEVFVDHVYHVTNAGLLAHNACGDSDTVFLYHGSKTWQGDQFDLGLSNSMKRDFASVPGVYMTDDFARAATQYGKGGVVVRVEVPRSFAESQKNRQCGGKYRVFLQYNKPG